MNMIKKTMGCSSLLRSDQVTSLIYQEGWVTLTNKELRVDTAYIVPHIQQNVDKTPLQIMNV